MFAAVTVVWLYLAGLWVVYDSIERDAEKEGAKLEMDFLGGLIILSWFVSMPALIIWNLLIGSFEDE